MHILIPLTSGLLLIISNLLAPPHGLFHDIRVRYLDIYGFATDSVEIRCIQPELIVHFRFFFLQKNEVLSVWPGAAQAPKLKPQVYSVQHQIPAKFHPDGSMFQEMATEKPIFGSQSTAMPVKGRLSVV